MKRHRSFLNNCLRDRYAELEAPGTYGSGCSDRSRSHARALALTRSLAQILNLARSQ
ncbi:MAG: hypothetical protein LRZ84_20610 [Desertifilum sp.]|nr:hypothetical protein [Desertifilum sp.]